MFCVSRTLVGEVWQKILPTLKCWKVLVPLVGDL
jgi:hypothetical protein